MGLCNKFAGIISPLIFAALVLKTSDNELFRQLNQNILIGEERTTALDDLSQSYDPLCNPCIHSICVRTVIRYSSLPEMNLRKQGKRGNRTLRKKGSIWDYPF
jgi:hypothetical protein